MRRVYVTRKEIMDRITPGPDGAYCTGNKLDNIEVDMDQWHEHCYLDGKPALVEYYTPADATEADTRDLYAYATSVTVEDDDGATVVYEIRKGD
jgi:hypothetical protein